jgi:hypothetical protein
MAWSKTVVSWVAAFAVGLPAGRGQESPDKGQAPGPAPLEARILVPLTGAKTALRFQVANTGKATLVDRPFVNGTRLLVTGPDGKTREIVALAENHGREALKPGATKHWDLDVADYVRFAEPGRYAVAFAVNGVRSNEVLLLAVDPAERARERAEEFLAALRAKEWDQAAAYVIATTGQHDARTRERMGIPRGASPPEARAGAAAWLKALYDKGAKVGDLRTVKLDARDADLARATYRHEDLDGFTLRRVGGEWYYTLGDR